MAEALKLARNLELPVDAVTQTFAFLGRRGSGKTYGATKLAELMLDVGAQIVALDPVGVWYGLRMNAAQTGPSPYAIPVLGGRHGDIPLEASAGKLIADLVVDRGTSIVLDVSMFESDAEKARFAEAFMARFFFRKKERPSAVHVFVEECQEFLAQNPQRGEERMLHTFTRAIKLGRNFGVGMSLISQRPQEVNKKALNMCECLLAFQMTGPQERKTIQGWAVDRGVDEDAESLSERLPFLEVGTAHVWSPQWLQVAQDSHILKKRTADVSSTPKVGDAPIEAKALGAIDLEQLRKSMAATIEKAKAEDPAELRAEISRLNAQVKRLTSAAPAKAAPDPAAAANAAALRRTVKTLRSALEAAMKFVVNVSTQNFDVAGVDKEALETAVRAAVDRAIASLDGRLESRTKAIDQLRIQAQRTAAALKAALESDEEVTLSVNVTKNEPFTVAPAKPRASVADREISRAISSEARSNGKAPGPQRLLDAAAKLHALGVDAIDRSVVAVLAGMSPTSSATERHFAANIGSGLFEIPAAGTVRLTSAGHAAAAAPHQVHTLDEYHDAWRRVLAGGEARLMDAMVEHGGEPIDRASLAERAGQSPTSSATERNFAKLIGLGLFAVAGKGVVRAGDLLSPAALV